MGASGTYFFKGYITAEEYSIDLQGKYGLQVYDVMRKSDPTIHAALNVCKQPILGANWDTEAASEEPLDVEINERLHRELFDRAINFPDVSREALTCLDFGFFVAETVWEATQYQGKSYIGLAKIASRKQRSILKWEIADGKDGITQILPSGKAGLGGGVSIDIPREKLLYVVNDQEGDNYFGTSLLRYAYKPWKIKDGLEIMNAVALERQGLGVPYAKKDMNGQTTDEAELIKVREMLQQHRANESGYWEYPNSIEVGFTDMKGNTTKEILPTIEYQDRQILLSTLAQFLLLGANGSSGSRAVSADHSRLFTKALEAVATTLQQAFQRDIVQKWVDLNYSNLPNGYPKLVFSTISDEDVKETADAVAALTTAGVLNPDREVENRLRKLLNLPPLATDVYDNYEEKTAKTIPVMDENGQPIKPVAPGTKPAAPVAKPSPKADLPSAKDMPDATDNEKTQAIAGAREYQQKLLALVASP